MPTTLDEALAHKDACPEAVPMAGGTDLMVCWPEHLERRDATYLDLSGVAGLRATAWRDDALILGAMTTYWDVLEDERAGREFPMLHEAASQVGAIQIQARGTWAGNVANGSPAADGVPVLMAYDAEVELASRAGVRTVPLDHFYHGYKVLEARPEELIRCIRIPRRPYAFARFEKVGARAAQAIAKVGVAVARSDAGWRVVASSVAPTVRRCPTIERLLEDAQPIERPEDLAAAIDADVSPIDDLRSTAAYRRAVLCRVLYFMTSPIQHTG
jgi:CO/xanthine dehydrogenase FAD-binding subunit